MDHPVITRFEISGTLQNIVQIKTGHINETLLSAFEDDGAVTRYIHQKINDTVFPEPDRVMENMVRVTRHQRDVCRVEYPDDADRRYISLVPARDGAMFVIDGEGKYWRTYRYQEDVLSLDVAENAGDAENAARTFGIFSRHLADLPGPPLFDTIPRFHDTPNRYRQLMEAVDGDIARRADSCTDEIAFFTSRRDETGQILDGLESGKLRSQVTHNDTKINNVLLDADTREGMCVIDLDTVMPGSILYDFGDLVRTASSPVAEDDPDADRVTMRMEIYRALLTGYLDGIGNAATDYELGMLHVGAKLITMNMGLRFLADYLNGDRYYRIERENHNLDRCRTQIALMRSMEDHIQEMTRAVELLR